MAKRKKQIRLGGFFLLVMIAAVLFMGQAYLAGRPVTLAETVSITIPDGSGTKAIAGILKDNGVIRSESAFVRYVKRNGLGQDLRSGSYTFSGEQSLADICSALKKGRGNATEVRVTIPEGLTVEQTAEIFADKGLVDKDKFIDYTLNGDFPYDYLPAKGTPERLEGFLFPDTYQISTAWDEEDIVNMLLKQFDKVFTEEWREKAEADGRSIYEVVTLASIVEREAKVAGDRPIIAGVFLNRLDIGMKLESCATVQYALGEVKPVLLYKDLEIDSPYNTYKNQGLTPTPIAAPGKASLEAALYPTESDYLFFLAKPDGSHFFSKTLAEHNAAKNKYLK
ncbi:MAG: endolytic transglycosylase MltG [Peptococcaceae bacterium]|nr:endolytic transglycosylase MltG [Peptococcaceae bacterium]